VVVETSDRMYVGRFDRSDDQGVHLIGVGIYDPVTNPHSTAEFIERTLKFGVKVDRPHLVVPVPDVARVRRLVEADTC
jgi:hypothetical protein